MKEFSLGCFGVGLVLVFVVACGRPQNSTTPSSNAQYGPFSEVFLSECFLASSRPSLDAISGISDKLSKDDIEQYADQVRTLSESIHQKSIARIQQRIASLPDNEADTERFRLWSYCDDRTSPNPPLWLQIEEDVAAIIRSEGFKVEMENLK